jgi:hypothetical protein
MHARHARRPAVGMVLGMIVAGFGVHCGTPNQAPIGTLEVHGPLPGHERLERAR